MTARRGCGVVIRLTRRADRLAQRKPVVGHGWPTMHSNREVRRAMTEAVYSMPCVAAAVEVGSSVAERRRPTIAALERPSQEQER